MTRAATTRCRALVAGFGVPAQRDLDFGRQVVRYLEPFRWPEGVVVEDLSYSAPLVLHRLHELHPVKLVLVVATSRGDIPPGTVRRSPLDLRPPVPDAVHEGLVGSLSGSCDLDHTLAILRHWGGLPEDSVLIEVEAADCSFGLGFSEELGHALDTVVTMVREELGEDGVDVAPAFGLDVSDASPFTGEPEPAEALLTAADDRQAGEGSPMASLLEYANHRREGQLTDRLRGGQQREERIEHPGVELVGRVHGWGVGLGGGGDWFDVIPLDGGRLGVVVGDAPGRGSHAAALKSDLRVAVQTAAVLAGDSPARLVSALDDVVTRIGRGQRTALAYLTVDPATGDVRLCSAGLCPPLVLEEAGAEGEFLRDGYNRTLGAAGTATRSELHCRLRPGSTLLLFTDGVAQKPGRSLSEGLERLAEAGRWGPEPLDALCEHVLRQTLDRHRQEDDFCLLGLRLLPR